MFPSNILKTKKCWSTNKIFIGVATKSVFCDVVGGKLKLLFLRNKKILVQQKINVENVYEKCYEGNILCCLDGTFYFACH